MADTFLIIITIVLAVVLLGISFYILALYCHPDDRGWGTSLFCKILVIAGFALSWSQVLILPLDVANSRGLGGGLDIATLWMIVYISVLVMVTFFLPFSIYLYESDDDKTMRQKFCYALQLQFCTLVVVCLILFISYAFLRYADLPLTIISKSFTNFQEMNSNLVQTEVNQKTVETTLEINVGFPVYVMAILSFFGWVIFVFFGGLGLIALPFDLIMEFVNRPQIRKGTDIMQTKTLLKTTTFDLIKVGEEIKEQEKEAKNVQGWWAGRQAKNKVADQNRKFKSAVFQLEKDHELFKLELQYLDHNPLVFYGKLILGILFSIFSLIWLVHIIIFLLATDVNGFPISPFLNDMLTGLEKTGITFLATGVFAILSLYLLWCTQKGNLKMGVRIPFLFTIHPMKINETWMNSFLFNVTLILISSVAVVQFCSSAFAQYTRNTEIQMMFSVQVRYMRFYIYFYDNNVFEISLVVWSALSFIYLIIKRSDKNETLRQIEMMKKENDRL